MTSTIGYAYYGVLLCLAHGDSGALAAGRVQGRPLTVVVRDAHGQPVPHAVLEARGGESRVADDSGRVFLTLTSDSVRATVRRLGYRPFVGFVKAATSGLTTVELVALPQRLAEVAVVAEAARSPLERSGFYDRLQRAQRGSFTAEFITPEELDARSGTRTTDLLFGRRFVFPQRTPRNGRQFFLRGRGGCKMTIFVDGMLVHPEPPSEQGASVRGATAGYTNPSAIVPIDEIVDIRAIAAIEMYASANQAPAEFLPLVGAAQEASCGIVVIWTGGRH